MSKRIDKASSSMNRVILLLALLILTISLAAVAAHEIVTTETAPALPGVFYDAPQQITPTKYCFAENTVLEFCIER